jgi:ankyrin repeat protein
MDSRRRFLKLAMTGTALGCAPLLLRAGWPGRQEKLPEQEPFLRACAGGDLETVKKQLKDNPQLLSAKDTQGRSGFVLALLAGHTSIGQFLKSAGYRTDLHESALDLDWERFGELVGEESADTPARINADHPVGGSTMWAAAAGGAGSDIWRVYAKCGDPNSNPRRKKGSTPLQQSLRYADLPTAEMTAATLLSNAAHPDPPPNADLPPLHIAAERGSFELVEMLIRSGADVNRKDQNGIRAGQLAEKNGHERVWELLSHHRQIPRICRSSRMAYDANLKPYQAPEDLGDIPQYLRSRLVGHAHNNMEYIQKEVAADPRMAHSVATTSEMGVEASAHMGLHAMVELLLEHGAPYSLPTAVMLSDYTTVRRLLDEDPNRIHERGAHDFGLLWYPVIGRCDLEMTRLLLDRGAKVEQQHYLGTTALHWACLRGPIELVELLVENGADVNRVGRRFNAKGDTPLQLVKDEKIADYLRSRGAK